MLLYGRLWFQRVWIVQEFIFGKTCVMWCGTLEFDPEILMQPARRLSAYRQLAKIIASLNSDGTAQYTNRIREMASLWLLKEIIGQGKPQGLRLMGLLWQTLAFQATDPRDKVFALVGLSHGVDPDFIDYKLNMHEVFIRGPGSSFVTTLRQLSRYCLLSEVTTGAFCRVGYQTGPRAHMDSRRS